MVWFPAQQVESSENILNLLQEYNETYYMHMTPAHFTDMG